ncbi:MAG: asparagine synthase C-terminal domain-containing protein [Phycisphaerae bacterium]
MSRRHVTVALGRRRRRRRLHGLQPLPARPDARLDRPAAAGAAARRRHWQRLPVRRGSASGWRRLGYADWAELYVTITSTLRTTSAGRVYAAPFVLDGSVFREVAQRLHGREPETLLALLDSTTTLTDKFLVKSDRAAMAASLEVRAPFLDHRLLEWAWALPRRYKLRGGVTKFLLRELVYRKVPRALVDRPKQGFSPPIETWLRGGLSDWVRETLAPRRVAATGVLNAPAVGRVVDRHLLDKAPLGQAVWTLLCFMTWHDRFMSPAAAPLPALRVAPERVA